MVEALAFLVVLAAAGVDVAAALADVAVVATPAWLVELAVC